MTIVHRSREIRPASHDSPAGFEKESQRPLHIRIGSHPSIIIVPYGLFMGIGFAAVEFVALSFGALSHSGLQSLAPALNLTLLLAVIFARLLSIIMEDGVAMIMTKPIRTLLRPGFWLHGGLLGATLGAILSWKIGYVENFSMFAGSLAMGLPLYETFSRIGCHTYGCCYGRIAEPSIDGISSQVLWRLIPFPAVRYNHPTHYAVTRLNPSLLHRPLVPIQLISATLFLLTFLVIALPVAQFTNVELAGSITLVCHAGVRLITETYRADYRGRESWWLSMTGKMALVQATAGALWLSTSLKVRQQHPEQLIPSRMLRVQKSLFAVALGIVVYGVHVGEVGSWVMTEGKDQS